MLAKIKQFVKLGSRTLTCSAFSGTNLSKALSKFHYLVKDYQSDIILVIGVILISFFSFAMGYIIAKTQEKEPLKIEFRLQPDHHPFTFVGPMENLESRILCPVIQLPVCSSMSMFLRA